MPRFSFVLLACIIAVSCVATAAETKNEVVGSVTDVKGAVHVIRGGQSIAVEKGFRLCASDVIQTGKGGGIGLVLRDDSTLSLGPSSELKMSEFKFKPDDGVLGLTLSLVQGTLVYISGQIAKLAPGSAKIETPAGVAAVRGTELLVEVPAPKATKDTEKAP